MDPASNKPPSSMFVSNKASNDSNPMGNHKIIPTILVSEIYISIGAVTKLPVLT